LAGIFAERGRPAARFSGNSPVLFSGLNRDVTAYNAGSGNNAGTAAVSGCAKRLTLYGCGGMLFGQTQTALQAGRPADRSSGSVTRIISVHSFRGGTGKSNLSANLAALYALAGKRVGVVDTDIQSPGIHILFGLQETATAHALNDYL